MEDLQRLVRIISKRKQRQYPLLELKSINENSSKENIFFRYIKKGIVNSDDEASKLIYGTKSDDDRFRMLKSRLKQKLLNHMFFLDFNDNNQRTSNQFEQESIQQLHQAKMLLFTGELKIAKSLVLKALTTAERCEFTKHIIASLEDLVQIYSENCQPHLFDDITKRLTEIRVLFGKEEEARVHFYHIKMMVVKSVNSRKKNLENVTKSIKSLEKLWNSTKSYNIFNYLYQLILLHKSLVGDFKGIISLLHEIENGQFKGHKLNTYRLDKTEIIIALAFAYLRDWNFEKGISYIEERIDLFDEFSSEWYSIYETYFLLEVYNKKYEKAIEIIDQVFENKSFERLLEEEKEKWKLFNVYVRLVSLGNFQNIRFLGGSTLEIIPEHDKDKEGFNAAIIILQFLYFLEKNNQDELAKRRDELKIYMANHFKENFSYRARTMYKLLNIVTENNLDLKNIQLKSRYLIKKLHENKVMSNVYMEMEIVPYEHLWDLIMRMLKYNEVRAFS